MNDPIDHYADCIGYHAMEADKKYGVGHGAATAKLIRESLAQEPDFEITGEVTDPAELEELAKDVADFDTFLSNKS